jgi:hypothetical protein
MDDESLRTLIASVLGPVFGAAVVGWWSWLKNAARRDVGAAQQPRFPS